MVARNDASSEKQLTIEIQVGQSIHSVNLRPSTDNPIKLTDEEVEGTREVVVSAWEEIGSEIIRLCEEVGLTIGDIRNVERHSIIIPKGPWPHRGLLSRFHRPLSR